MEATNTQKPPPRPALQFPRLNEPAPAFAAPSTRGPIALADYLGRYVVLFSHPADFTPVCTTEFVAFAEHYDQFQALGCDLIGLSIDSAYSHLAWVRNMKEKFGVEIPFPIIADLSMEVSHKYGMIHPGSSDTSTVRAVFVIDDKGVLRAMVYYPKDNGRSITEIIRLVKALQTTDQHQVATPAGWQPGDKVIVPPPGTAQAAERRLAEAEAAGYECIDWYLCTKEV
jgi:peroxiredoxin (alkyl hydroperoxide reductase subunit C)